MNQAELTRLVKGLKIKVPPPKTKSGRPYLGSPEGSGTYVRVYCVRLKLLLLSFVFLMQYKVFSEPQGTLFSPILAKVKAKLNRLCI